MSFLRLLTLMAWLVGGFGIVAAASAPALAAARTPAVTAAVVEGFDLEQVSELAPGVALNFSVYGSPGAEVTLYIEGVGQLIELAETRPGIYEGTYVIAARDRLRSDSGVIATLQHDGQVARSTLAEPLLLERGAVPWTDAVAQATAAAPMPAPPPARFTRAPSDEARARAPRAGEPVPIADPASIASASEAAAPARGAPPLVEPARRATPVPRVARAPARPACGDCAVVETIRVEPATERRGVIGAIAGGIAGAVLGDKLAEAHRRHMMQALGALTGALLGREIEMRQSSSPAYTVVLRLPDGSALERRYDQAPPFRVGDSVSLSGTGTRVARTAVF